MINIRFSSTVASETYTYSYDDWGRPTVTTHKLGTGSAVTLFSRAYDRAGRIASESRNGGTTGLQTAYTYNVRSWLTDLSVGSDGSTFQQNLYYNEGRNGATVDTSQWGGNIARMDWKAGDDNSQRTYQFGYDKVSRLTGATFTGPSAYRDNFTRTYSYDSNGNVISRGEETFTYNGNHLSTGTYDANGNLTAGLGYTTSYNLLNLPSSAVTADQTTNYYYTSDGTKVEKEIFGNNSITLTYYAGNLFYNVSSPKMLLIEGGYVDLTGDTPAYRFYVTDHQGNIRAVTDAMGTILRTNHYDPYGEEVLPVLTSANDLPVSTAGTTALSRYMYSAKEWDSDLSLYDFSARYYTPGGAVSFTTMDPLAEKYYSISPYAYCAGNPMRFIDPSGLIFTERAWEHVDRLINDINKRQADNADDIERKQAQINAGGLPDKRVVRLQNRIKAIQDKNSELEKVRGEIAVLAVSSQLYDIRRDNSMNIDGPISGIGEYRSGASFNFNNGSFDIALGDSSLGTLAHELKHAYQFEIGSFSSGRAWNGEPFYDKTDEIAAYERGALFGGQHMSSLPRLYKDLQSGPMDATRLAPIILETPSELQKLADRTKSAFRINGVTYIMRGDH